MSKKLIKQFNEVCCNCERPIGFVDGEDGLYMPIEGGKFIHWNCDDAIPGEKYTYLLVDEFQTVLATSDKKDVDRLSITNCKEIAHVDVNELAETTFAATITTEDDIEISGLPYQWGFKVGFKKALELQGDKIFTKTDMLKAILMATSIPDPINPSVTIKKKTPGEIIDSLMTKEWDVEIVTEPYYDGEFIDDGKTHMIETKHRPKLDEDGCLILRRVKDEK